MRSVSVQRIPGGSHGFFRESRKRTSVFEPVWYGFSGVVPDEIDTLAKDAAGNLCIFAGRSPHGELSLIHI